MFDADRIEWLSFDCYGTLVDWETGICRAVSNVLVPHGVELSDADILSLFFRGRASCSANVWVSGILGRFVSSDGGNREKARA